MLHKDSTGIQNGFDEMIIFPGGTYEYMLMGEGKEKGEIGVFFSIKAQV